MAMNFVTFNQDHSLLAVGTSRGFRIYYTDPFSLCFEEKEGDVAIMEMLFSTSLVALILSPRLLRIQNTKRGSTICELTFPTRVLAVRLNRKRLVVVLEETIYLYDVSNMKLLETLTTSMNPLAICALSPSSDHNYLAYPLPAKVAAQAFAPPSHAPPTSPNRGPTSGELMIYDATKMEPVNVIDAHQTPLSCITLNNEGTLLATASEKGTIIRVFSLPDVQKLYQFRRGSIPARIYSMSFNATSTLLCVSSATETVHIFRLSPNARARPTSGGSNSGGRGSLDRRRPSSSASAASASSLTGGSPPGASGIGESSATSAGNGDQPERPANPGFAGILRRTSQNVGKTFAARVGGYLPSSVTEMWEPMRDFAWVKIPRGLNATAGAASGGAGGVGSPGGGASGNGSSGGGGGTGSGGPLRTVVAMSASGPQVMVVTSEGNLFYFNIDLEKGGEGTLLKQVSVLETNDRLRRTVSDE